MGKQSSVKQLYPQVSP